MLLDELRKFDVSMWNGPTLSQEEFRTFLRDVSHLLNGARLFGTNEVREAAEQVDLHIAAIELHVGTASLPFGQALEEAVGSLGKGLNASMRVFVDAMRADVAPASSSSA